MGNLPHLITLSSYVALACSGVPLSTGCQGAGDEPIDAARATLEVRFQDSGPPQQPASAGALRLASLAAAPTTPAAGPTTHDQVTRILVDVRFADTGQPFFLGFDLTRLAPDVWQGDVPLLPRDRPLRFAARALTAAGEAAFSGETLATLTIDHQRLAIPLAPAQDGTSFQIPRMLRIAYPAEIFAGQEEPIAFTIQGNAGAAIGIQITPLGGATPAAELAPATGTVTLTGTVADFVAAYTAPGVTADTPFDYQVTITDARAEGAVAVTTNFRTTVKPRPPGTPIVAGTTPSVLFNPVILGLTANGSELPGTVELFAAVSDDSPPDQLSYEWSYTPDPGTPDATFDGAGLGNPGSFQGYTVAHQGTITLAVTDEHHGTTTLHYRLAPGQFADAIDHASVDGRLRSIVSGKAHTCVLTGEGRVRCWGSSQFGQLGYGNTIGVGDAPPRLPFTAGDVPLPASDPVLQLVAGNNHTCALLQSGLVYCWGDNQFGQLGEGRTDNLGDTEPVTSFGVVTLGDLATRIAAGGDHTCAILRTGTLRCWGRNDSGQLGRGHTQNLGDNEPVYSAGDVDLGAGVTVKSLALGGAHTCALLTTGAVRCWGRNDAGQLGYGHNRNLGDDEPINNLPNVSLSGTVRKLVAGAAHTCALTFAGTLRCWGDGRSGQLGQSFGGGDALWGNAAGELPSALPGDVHAAAPVTDVTAGDSHTCALSSDGPLTCWGLGTSGQLGYGNFGSLSTPPAAGVNLDGVTAYRIAAGAAHTCALRRNDTARCWGAGTDGRLGRGSTATSASATGKLDIQIFAPAPACGNGALDPGEQCDDGNTINDAACDDDCTAPRCGNGIVDAGEQCDDGNALGGDGCGNNCILSRSVGGSVSGLGSGESVVLQNNAGDNLAVSANGGFTFATQVQSGAAYEVTVLTSPPGTTCTVANGAGTIAASNITSVAVTCTGNPCALPWGGSIHDGQSVTAYQASTTSCGGSCVSETRTCSRGVLSGTYTNQTCTFSCRGSFFYTASNTSSASQNTTNFAVSLLAGQTLTAGTCGVAGGSGSGDTYLRLFDPFNTLVTLNDDACGGLLSIVAFRATVTGSYLLRAGCFLGSSCSGTVAWTVSP